MREHGGAEHPQDAGRQAGVGRQRADRRAAHQRLQAQHRGPVPVVQHGPPPGVAAPEATGD